MSTATSSATTSDPNWATPASQVAAPQWQSQEQYQQYYNYYQAMSQASMTNTNPVAATTTPVAAATVGDPATAYPQDYSKAWDEYYKAYYGQSYPSSAPAAQYPATGYNYDQYGYPNLAAPPPSYQYETVATSSAYQYGQAPPAAPVASAVPVSTTAYNYSDANYTAPPTSTWNEPPPSFEKPATFNNQTYQQPSTYEKPPSFDQGNSYGTADTGTRATTMVDSSKTENYMDRFPPPSFESSNKQGGRPNNRGRGFNRGDQRPPRGNRFGSNNKNSRGGFNDRSPYDNEDTTQYNNNNRQQTNNFDRPTQFQNNDFQDEDTSYSTRGSRAPFRGRGGDSSFRGRGGDFNFRGRGGDSAFRGRGGFDTSNRRSSGFEDQSWNSTEDFQDHAWKSELEKPDMTKKSSWETEQDPLLPGWTMGGVKRKLPMNVDDGPTRIQNKPSPQPLMDIAVRPSGQSPIIVRRQGLIDQWQSAVREITDRKFPIKQYWITLKSGLVPEVQGLLCPSFVRGDNVIHCELHLDDIFLVQAKGNNEDMAIEEASKMMWQMLQTKLYVHTASRSWVSEKVPVFCVSRSVNGPVSCPPFIKGVAPTEIPQTQKVSGSDKITSVKHDASAVSSASVAPVATTKAPIPEIKAPMQHNYKEDDIFLVVDPSLNEKDQAISILNNTAKFNHITIEYKHEKPPNAPHISQCLITINGQEFEKSEARDYLCAKREAADKAVVIFKDSCPQVTLNFDQARDVNRDGIMKPGKSYDESIGDFLRSFAGNADEDVIFKFGQHFTNEDREAILKVTNNLNLSSKSEGKGILMIFKQYPIEEMKRRILRKGYCAQYRLVQCSLNKGSS